MALVLQGKEEITNFNLGHFRGPHFNITYDCSASIAQFGALLRLRTWHNAFVDIVVPDNYLDVWQRPLKEWKEAVGMARVWSSSQWTPRSGTMWRGSVNITEKKVQCINVLFYHFVM